ncbi:UbiA family prenyltransferase [Derxia lacustris]|uniref:UbiA family prenyltransferase n=1 Tax=Derxia lacustris TaxID=764842 RepID=UPI00111C113D|nr:UbiA family prenyltransferase [Derxia lacustris]
MSEHAALPLCLDLDGTLTRTDTLHESVLELLKTHPLLLLRLPFWLAGGKASMKARLAEHARPAPDALPYRTDLVEWARRESATRPVYLATAAHRSVAEPIAAHLGFFSGVFATDGVNLSSHRKAAALSAQFGARGFAYAGNSSDDLAVWAEAGESIVVEAPAAVTAKARAAGTVAQEFDNRPASALTRLRLWVRALRLYQWVKNLLIFLAPLAAHVLDSRTTLLQCLVAFAAFGCAASSIYLVNDLLDLPADRAHPRKRLRPFAAGDLPVMAGMLAAPLVALLAIGLGALVGPRFLVVLLIYLVTTTAYSTLLKRKLFVDVATLAALYTLRVVAGAAAVGVALSFWLLALCAYGFLSLALLKRYAELVLMTAAGKTTVAGRAYGPGDTPVVLALGAAAGMVATFVTAFYIDSQTAHAQYRHPEFLWSLVALMTLGLGRIWLKAGRGEMHDDPIVFVARDRFCLTLVGLGVLASMLAT